MIYELRDFGARGDGETDDSESIQRAVNWASERRGALHVPSGSFRFTRPIVRDCAWSPLSISGDGPNVAQFLADNTDGFDFSFSQIGAQQPAGLTLRGVGFRAIGRAGTALAIRYGSPPVTSEHFRPALRISEVNIESGDEGTWSNGIDIEGAWNPRLSDVFISGDPCGGNWNDLRGVGINLRGMCVNAHLSNVSANFFPTGLKIHAEGGPNTEGIFCSNCSMVGVRRGVWIQGNPFFRIGDELVPRISTFTWHGGLIECRYSDTDGAEGIFLQHVHTALISGAQILCDRVPNDRCTTAVLVHDSIGVVVGACDLNAFTHGVISAGTCRGVSVSGNTFTNVATQSLFTEGTLNSRAGENVRTDGEVVYIDVSGKNRVGLAA